MAVAEWTFVYCDRNSVPQGEILNAAERKVAKPLNSLDTASFRVRLDNPLVDALSQLDGFVKAYRNGVLEFHGLLLSAEENLDDSSATLAVNCIDCGWLLNKRLAGKSKTGQKFAAGIPSAQIMDTLIQLSVANDGPMGIDVENNNTGQGGVYSEYTAGPYRNLYEILKELSAGLNGFDWRFLPVENFFDGAVYPAPYLGLDPYKSRFWAQTAIGSTQTNAVFEFGLGRNNVQSYKRTITRDGQANRVYNNAQAGPDAPGYPTVSALDATSIADWYLMEDLIQADLINQSARQSLADAHVAVRKNPKQVVEFTPHLDDGFGRVPRYGIDFGLGDRVRGRFAYHGVVRLDAYIRLYGVTFDVDAEGAERITFTLVEQE